MDEKKNKKVESFTGLNEYLNQYYMELCDTLNQKEAVFNKNLKSIKELDKHIVILKENKEEDSDIFGLRKTKNFSEGKLEELNLQRVVCLKENEELKENIDALKNRIEKQKECIAFIKSSEKKKGETEEEESKQEKIKMLEIQEAERQRIARELHDSTVQNLTCLIHKTEMCFKLMDLDPIRCKLELQTMKNNLRDIVSDMREVIYDLRPMSFDDMGVQVTIQRFLNSIKNDVKVRYRCDGEVYKLPQIVELSIFRIIQEATNNVLKHAEATEINIVIKYQTKCVIIEIGDNGKGFDSNQKERDNYTGFGLSMMKERVFLLSGKIKIDTEKGQGTKISIEIPN